MKDFVTRFNNGYVEEVYDEFMEAIKKLYKEIETNDYIKEVSNLLLRKEAYKSNYEGIMLKYIKGDKLTVINPCFAAGGNVPKEPIHISDISLMAAQSALEYTKFIDSDNLESLYNAGDYLEILSVLRFFRKIGSDARKHSSKHPYKNVAHIKEDADNRLLEQLGEYLTSDSFYTENDYTNDNTEHSIVMWSNLDQGVKDYTKSVYLEDPFIFINFFTDSLSRLNKRKIDLLRKHAFIDEANHVDFEDLDLKFLVNDHLLLNMIDGYSILLPLKDGAIDTQFPSVFYIETENLVDHFIPGMAMTTFHTVATDKIGPGSDEDNHTIASLKDFVYDKIVNSLSNGLKEWHAEGLLDDYKYPDKGMRLLKIIHEPLNLKDY